MPPLAFLNFGIPPAKRPPSCGALSTPALAPPPASLLLLNLFEPPGTGGARPVGVFIPGTGGAPPTGGPPPTEPIFVSTIGADLSLVTAFFNCLPFDMSLSRAPYNILCQLRDCVVFLYVADVFLSLRLNRQDVLDSWQLLEEERLAGHQVEEEAAEAVVLPYLAEEVEVEGEVVQALWL